MRYFLCLFIYFFVLEGNGLVWPNGLAVDLGAERIYWVDGWAERMESANYDGTDRRVVLRGYPQLKQPFSVFIFQVHYCLEFSKNSAKYFLYCNTK